MQARENTWRAITRQAPAWVPNGKEAIVRIMPPVVERPTSEGVDAFGVHWSLDAEAEGGTYPTRGGHTITDLCRWRDQITLPDVATLDWSAVQAQANGIGRERFIVEGFVEMGLFERSYLLLGMEEALMAYITEPEAMAELLNALADYKIALIGAFHEAAHLDMIWYGDDWGTQSNLFVPPAVWRSLLRPPTQRIYACMQERGILVNQHSCGKIESIVGDLVEMGADMWNPCQPCNDLAALKSAYGQRLAFYGGLDSQFVLGRPGVTAAEVRTEVRRRMDELAAGGGYIAAPSHSVPYDPAILAAMNDEIARYGRAIYAKN